MSELEETLIAAVKHLDRAKKLDREGGDEATVLDSINKAVHQIEIAKRNLEG